MQAPQQEQKNISDLLHHHSLSSEKSKLEVTLLKIAMDAVDAYNNVCEDHHIELVSNDEMLKDIDNAITSHSSAVLEQEIDIEADEEAIAMLSETLGSSDTEFALEENEADEAPITAEMVADMIGGNSADTTEDNQSDSQDVFTDTALEASEDTLSEPSLELDSGDSDIETLVETATPAITAETSEIPIEVAEASLATEPAAEEVALEAPVEESILPEVSVAEATTEAPLETAANEVLAQENEITVESEIKPENGVENASNA